MPDPPSTKQKLRRALIVLTEATNLDWVRMAQQVTPEDRHEMREQIWKTLIQLTDILKRLESLGDALDVS